ncbi:MAG: CAP family protein [Prolixibacteraceae bacterium]
MKLFCITGLFVFFAFTNSWNGKSFDFRLDGIVPEETGSSISREDAVDALRFHNNIRKDVGSPPLEWSEELAKYAQEWANYLAEKNNCRIAHRSTLGKADRVTGENIFRGTGKEFSALDASKAWYEEIENYTYQPIRANSGSKTGHYTQMVWKSSRKAGIGKAKCSNGSIIIVANYDPPGNVIGKNPY